MTEQAQPQTNETPVEQPAEQNVQHVGFGKALMMMEPDWRNKFSPDQINSFRHFYNQGAQDVTLVMNVSEQSRLQQLNSHLTAIHQTIIRTGNEAAIEAAEREAAAKALAEQQAANEAAGEAEAPKEAPKAKAAVSKRAVKQASRPAAKQSKKR